MSAGRRSWRPEKKRKGQDDRRIKIIVLSGLLVVLVTILLLPFVFSPEPPVRFVSLETDPSAAEAAGLTAAADSVSLISRLQLDSVFRKLHVLNPGLVEEPATVSTLPDLRNAVKPGEKLVLYCGVPARAESDQDAPDPASATIVMLHPGPAGKEIRLEKLLDTLKQTEASQIVLLMDLTDRTPGLANGILSDDVVELLNTSVSEANIPGLSLICSSTARQRSWEFLTDATSTDGPVTDSSLSNEGAGAKATDTSFGLFSGTVFAHFVGEAFARAETTTARQLGEYLQNRVAGWVQDHYGEAQTVTLLGDNVQSDDSAELLRKGGWSVEDLASTRDPLDPEPLASNSTNATDQTDSKTQETAKETSESKTVTPETEFARLLDDTRTLDPNCRAIDPSDWIALNALLVGTRNAMLQGDQLTFGKLYDRARNRQKAIADSLKMSAKRDTDNNFSPWINLPWKPGADQTEQNAITQSAVRYVQDSVAAAPEDNLKQLPRDLWGQPFADAFVNDLQELSENVSGNPDSQSALITPRVRLIRFLGEARPGSWPKKDWPQELLTIDEVLATDGAEPERQPLPQLTELIELRQRTLAMAAGFTQDGSRIRAHAWDAESAKLQRLLIQLTAVERWLSMGSVGFSMAEQTLTDARSQFGELNDLLKEQQKRSVIQDAQQTDLAFLIQYLAQQHEQVPLTPRELDAALQLVDSDNPRLMFPDGLLKPLDMDAMHIDAMFALTRDLEQIPVTDTDLRDHARLRSYVARRISGPVVAVEERHRLLNLPGFETSAAELIRGLRENGPKAATGGNQTGIWLAFWSIRLLDAVSHQAHPELWAAWKQLVQHVKTPASQTALVRIQLAEQLRSQWADFQTSLKNQDSASVFASRAESSRLISQDLSQRHQASARNSAHYARIHQTLLNETLPARTVAFSVAKPELKVDQENRASIAVTSAGGAAIYVSRSRFVLEQVQTDLKKGWQRLENDRPQRDLMFRANNALTDITPLTLALVNSADVVLATQNVIIHPGTDTTWDLEFLLDNQPLTLLDSDLRLPPTTLDRKDEILPLTVRLTQRNGNVKQVQVQAFTGPVGRETELWEEPQTLDITDQQVVIPLRPATTDTAAPASPGVAPPTIDLQDGIRFEVRPLGFETKSTFISIQPVLFAPSHFVRPPQANYDAGRRTLTISVQPESHSSDPLWPEKLPLEIHFSPALDQLRQGEAATKAPSLPDDGKTFEFAFREAIEQAFRNDANFVDDERNLEFGLSVAGVPYAWQWHLRDNAAELLLKDAPIVRATLTLSPDNKAKPVPTDRPMFLFAKTPEADATEPIFDVQMHIFRSGVFQRQNPEWELQLRVQNTATDQSARVLDPPIRLTSRHQQSITVSAGENGTWNFSTRTEAYQRRNLQINRQLGLGAGSYALIAGVQRIGRTGDQPQEHRIPFVIDATPPEVSINVPTANMHSVLKPLDGFVKADDRESDVATHKVTLDGGEPLPVNNGKFTIPVTLLPKLQPGPGETKTAEGTIKVSVTNGAGLESEPVEQRVVFFSKGPPSKAMAPAPAPPGAVTFESKSTEFKVLLWQAGKVVARGGGSETIEFKEIPPGKYMLTWSGPMVGQKDVTVKSGQTTKVAP